MVLCVLLTVHVSLNFAFDPLGEFRNTRKPISFIRDGDAYRKMRGLSAFIRQKNGNPVGVVLGSSRVMMLDMNADSTGVSFYNCGISGGKAEDFLAFTRYLLRIPRADVEDVLIGVDPPFSLETPTRRNDGGTDYGDRLKGVYGLEHAIADRVNVSERVPRILPALFWLGWIFTVNEGQVSDDPGRFDQAGILAESVYVNLVGNTAEDRESYLQTYVRTVLTEIPASTKLDPRRTQDLLEAIRLLRERGIHVTVFLPPTNPVLFAALQRTPAFLTQLRQFRSLLEDEHRREGITFVDLTDATDAGLSSLDFWDGYHYTGSAARRVARELGSQDSMNVTATLSVHIERE